MRFKQEIEGDPENSGLIKAKNILDPVKSRNLWITYADL